jgi:mono/diheme cytochrome c family protein
MTMQHFLVRTMVAGIALFLPIEFASAQTAAVPDNGATLKQYCFTCHNDKLKTGGLSLESLDLAHPSSHSDVWEKVIRKARVGMMPPQGLPQPDPAARKALVTFLETSLDRAAAEKPNPGRPLVHRLNRAEYANAIRDLLGLNVDTTTLLPPDDSGYGFDNIADVLGVSPVLLEAYVSAAGKISALAVGDPNIGAAGQTFRARQDASQDVHIEGLPLGTIGGLRIETTLPLDGEYLLQPKYFRTNLGVLRGLETPTECEIAVDGVRVHLAPLGGDADFKASLANMTTAADAVDARCSVRVKLKAGPRVITSAFLRGSTVETTLRLQPFIRSSNDTLDPAGRPHLDSFTVTGPFNATGPGDTPSRRQIFSCRPTTQAQEEPCARKILTTLMRRGYRGEGSDKDLQRLMTFYTTGRTGGTFESGIEVALERLLASPKFAFRTERDPAGAAPGTVYRISGLELASRLSFFLWSSIPDDELLRLANEGKLNTPAVLDQQMHRMLGDPKSAALIDNFAGQWLYLRNLRTMIPNSLEFPDFDDNLRQAFQHETELFFGSIIHEDRNVLDLMTANYTFINERLAKHYGIPNIYGSNFRRITVTDEARKGLLGQGSILMVSSHTDRTSPVVRGKWVMDNLLGAPPPPPPANVPPLDESNNKAGRVLTMRERMEAHRANPYCASCHKMMDPIGFSLENFDATGAWRTKEGGTGGTAIDASGQLMDGTKINGPVELRQALLRNPEIFLGTFTEKLMTYALGRGLSDADGPVVRSIVRDAARNDYRFTSIVKGIILSTPFEMRIKATEEPAESPKTVAGVQ